jgi:hypothetical protein
MAKAVKDSIKDSLLVRKLNVFEKLGNVSSLSLDYSLVMDRAMAVKSLYIND